MKIGMILDAAFPPDPRVENEALVLVNAGFEVYLFCLNYKNLPVFENYKGIHIQRFKANKLIYKLSALAYTFPFYTNILKRKISTFLEKNQLDALHVHDIRVAQAALNANKKYKIPFVLDLHDNLPEVMKLYPHLQKFPGKYLISPKKWKKKETEFIKKADKVIAVSPEFVANLKGRFPKLEHKFLMVPNTIHPQFYTEYTVNQQIINKYKNHFVILYLGDTHLRRGLQTVIQAIPQLKEIIKNIKLVIVGKNTTDTILKTEVKKLNLDKEVDFEGWQDVHLFQSYILASEVCISPLHKNLQHDVAYANKLFQYMSFAKPLLVSDAKAQANLIHEIGAGLIHKEKDAADFADKLLDLYNNKNLRTKMGVNGKTFVQEKFNWEQTSKPLINYYKTLC